MKYNNINNLSQWAIILYLTIHDQATRKQMAIDFNVSGPRIGYFIRRLKDQDLVATKFGKNKKEVLYYLV